MRYKVVLFLLILGAGCAKQPAEESVILAEVGDRTLLMAEAKSEIPVHVFEADSISATQNYAEDWVRRQVILQEAERLNFAQREEVQKQLRRLYEEYILNSVQDYIVSEYSNDVTVTEEEARNYYQQNKDKFTLDQRYVQYRHLVARGRQHADNAKRDLMRGIPWEKVAKDYSLYAELKIRESERFWPISVAGGDISMLNRYLNVIGPSEISPIYRSGNQYHFVQLISERPKGDHPDLDWLISQIKEWLVLEKRKRAFNTYVKNLYLHGQANNEIKIYNVLTEEQSPAVLDTTDTVAADTAENHISNE